MSTIEVNGVKINYQLDGADSGDLIVFVNGLADDLSTWEGQVPAFHDAGYRVLRYDNRGFVK